ncbi:MAG: hypothetical protein IJ071_09465 [Ruminococcus sp.]|nr:hypothetical protein [Ruminococcus sp.]
MKLRLTALAAALLLGAASVTACGDKKSSSSDVDMDTYKNGESSASNDVAEDFKDVAPVSDQDGALLTISNTTAKAGETAEITISVSNADYKWNMCGFHVTYPNVLTPQFFERERRLLKYEPGHAIDYASGFVAMWWEENLPQELIDQNKGAFFITSIFDDDRGQDGDIVTLYFDVPADAESGTVYNFDFYYQTDAVFSNAAKDPGYDKYVFEHWTGGTVTVE